MQKDDDILQTQLQETLKEKISEMGISVHALEKKAGLKRSAVQNILQGRSKKPGVHILQAVAKILGCNINELLNNSQVSFTNTHEITESEPKNQETFNFELYGKAVSIAQDVFSKCPTKLNTPQSLRYIKEIYQYTIDSHLECIDKIFAAWLAGKYILMVESRF